MKQRNSFVSNSSSSSFILWVDPEVLPIFEFASELMCDGSLDMRISATGEITGSTDNGPTHHFMTLCETLPHPSWLKGYVIDSDCSGHSEWRRG